MASRTVRLAKIQDVQAIHALAAEVQAGLAATGSPQVIAPLYDVESAVEQQGCFILAQHGKEAVGCVILRPLTGDYYLETDFVITALPDPRWSLHSMMLAPGIQGQGIGKHFFQTVMAELQGRAKSVLLDCFAGNDKLRKFYTDAGCTFVGIAREDEYDVAIFVCTLPSQEDSKGKG